MADMTGTTSDLGTRVAELEARLREMERRDREKGAIHSILSELLPAEVREHMRAARKEQLLAVRSLLDHWIERVERRETAETRERITLD